jgi:hypothetical protein
MQDIQMRAVEALNHILKLDPAALSLLMEIRVMANEELSVSDSVVLMVLDEKSEPGVRPGDHKLRNQDLGLGLLGVINTILGPGHRVAADYADDNKTILNFAPYRG